MTVALSGRVPIGESLSLTLDGLAPGGLVTITGTLAGPDGLRWRSSADFTADSSGTVDVASAAPAAGSYQGADANGLLWSLVPDQPQAAESSAVLSGLTALDIEISCQAGGRQVACGQVRVERTGPGTSLRAVREDGLVGELQLPAGSGPFPPVLVVGGSGGDANEGVAAFLAAHGYLALALQYFAAPGLPAELIDIDLEYFGRALRWLARQPEAAPGRLGVVGRSRGGELALLLGLHLGVETVIAFVPSGIVHSGIRPGPDGWLSDAPAWRFDGRALPYLSHAGGKLEWLDGAIWCTPTYLRALADWSSVQAATMALEECSSDVLLISGTDDAVWPSALFGELALSRLRRRGHAARHRHLALPGAGHRFLPSALPATVTTVRHAQAGERLVLGGTPAGNARAGQLAYAAMLAALGGKLAEEEPN